MSVIQYGLEIYAADQRVIDRLQVLQNIVMRLVLDKDKKARIADMIAETGWLKIKQQQAVQRCQLLFKTMYSSCIQSWSMLLSEGAVIGHRFDMRRRELKVSWQPIRVRQGLKSSLIGAVKSWNLCKLHERTIPWDKAKRKMVIVAQLKTIGSNL